MHTTFQTLSSLHFTKRFLSSVAHTEPDLSLERHFVQKPKTLLRAALSTSLHVRCLHRQLRRGPIYMNIMNI